MALNRINNLVVAPSLCHIPLISLCTYTQMFPVMAMCGHRCGLHITATTAIYKTTKSRVTKTTEDTKYQESQNFRSFVWKGSSGFKN